MLTVIQRSTSLKAKKSPPTSPRRKKIVRFADTLGLDLAAVKTIMQEDLPLIPDSAFVNLNVPKELLPIRDEKVTTCRESAAFTNSPLSQRKNHLNSLYARDPSITGAKPPFSPFAYQYPASPIRNTSSLNKHRHHRPIHDRLANSLNRLHLDSDEEDDLMLDDHLLFDSTATVSPLSSIYAAGNLEVKSMLSNKDSDESQKILQTQKRQEVLSKSMPPWLALYQSNHTATLIPEFIEPFIQMNFIDRVRAQKVCLENCYISPTVSSPGTICNNAPSSPPASPLSPTTNHSPTAPLSSGSAVAVTICIRVVNLSFEKEVYCRFTCNNWATWSESKASYIPSSSDHWSDRFTATFTLSNLNAGQKVQFAIRYRCGTTEEYWDNNNGQNYSLMYRI